MPTPTPTAEQIESVREIVDTETLAETSARVSVLTDEQWTKTRDDIDEWVPIRSKASSLNGKIAGFVSSKREQRAIIRNRVRRRLGFAPLPADYELNGESQSLRSQSVPIEFVW